jgi:hypothetical protein
MGLVIIRLRQHQDYRASDDKVIGDKWRSGKILKGRGNVIIGGIIPALA